MPGHVEGTFTLHDRASEPARKIRFELKELQHQAERTGRSLDDVGGIRNARALDQTGREMRVLGRETHTTSGEMGTMARQTHRASGEIKELETRSRSARRETGSLGASVRELGQTLRGLGAIMGLLKWPAMIAGAGGLVQVIGGLSAGAIELVPALKDVAGAGAALIPLYAGIGGVMVTAKLATADLSQAYGGNAQALKRLTPEARGFLEVLRDQSKMVTTLKRDAQRGMFPGLTDALNMAPRAESTLRRIMRQQGGDIGNFARDAARQVTDPRVLGNLSRVSDQGARMLGGAARAGVDLADALLEISVAAEPLTDWLTDVVEGLGKTALEEARVGRETGSLGAYFERTRARIEQFARIGHNVFDGLLNIMGATRSEGDRLWDSIEHGSETFEKWTGSFTGQTEMRRFFVEMRPVIKETAGLVGDVAEGFAEIANGPEGAIMLRELRAAVPDLVRGIRELTTGFGPSMIGAVRDVVGLFAEVAGHGGPLTLMAEALGTAAGAATRLLHALGPLGDALALAFGAQMLLRRVGALKSLAGAISGVRRAATAETGVAAAGGGVALAGVAAAAGGAAAGVPAGGAAAGGGMMMMPAIAAPVGRAGTFTGEPSPLAGTRAANGAFIMGPAPQDARAARLQARRVAAGLPPTRGAVGYGAPLEGGWLAPRTPGAISRAVSGSGLVARGRAGLATTGNFLTAPGGAARLGGGALRMAGPTMLLMGLMAAAGQQGDLQSRTQAGLSALTLGAVPRPVGAGEQEQAAGAEAQRFLGLLPQGGDVRTQRANIASIRGQAMGARGNDRLGEKNADPTTYTRVLKQELDMRRQLLRETIDGQAQDLREASVKHAHALMEDFGQAFTVRSKTIGPEKAMDDLSAGVIGKLKSMNPAGRKVLAENTLAWAREQARHNPALLSEVQALERGIKTSFSRTGRHVQIVNGRILTGSQTEWHGIHLAITTETEKARQEASADFTAMQNEAVGSLVAMGYSRSEAKGLVAKIERGNKRGASASDKLTAQRAQGAATPGGAAAPKFNPGAATAGDVNTGDGYGWGDGPGLGQAGNRDSTASARAATSGAMTQAGGGLMGAKPGLGAYAGIGQQMGLRVSSGRRPGSITVSGNVSYHSSGDAIDMSGSPDAMMRYARYMSSNYGGQLEELIHTPAGRAQIKNGQPYVYTGAVAAQHFDHVHVADTAPGGAGGAPGGVNATGGFGGSVSITAPRSRNAGLPGAAHDAATSMYAAGLEQALNANLTALGGGGATTPTGPLPAGGARELGRQMMIAHGWDASQWPALDRLWTRESNWNPNAVNKSSGAMGIPQALGHGSVFALGDAQAQIAWGLNYIAGRYGSPSGAWAHEQSAGWYKDGGDFVVNRPTIFGAGEAGEERVTITPKGRDRGAGTHISISDRAVVVNGHRGASSRRVQEIVDRRLREFAAAVRDELDAGDVEDREAVIGG